ncbi:MAG: hypothetical protein HRU20_09855 [Pseudomonadales bacterium]|nr:hypothetical protein [Pseudomonadales bacterium]
MGTDKSINSTLAIKGLDMKLLRSDIKDDTDTSPCICIGVIMAVMVFFLAV